MASKIITINGGVLEPSHECFIHYRILKSKKCIGLADKTMYGISVRLYNEQGCLLSQCIFNDLSYSYASVKKLLNMLYNQGNTPYEAKLYIEKNIKSF